MEKPKQDKKEISKASNLELEGKVSASYYKTGYQNLRVIEDYVDQEQVSALRYPQSLSTYDKMSYDHDVQTGYLLSQIFVEKAFVKPEVEFNKASAKSREAAEFVKWNLANMNHTLQQAIRDAYTCKKYGFSLLVKRWEPITVGKYKGKYKYKLKALSPRAQKTLDRSAPFIMKDGEVVAARQDLNHYRYTSSFSSPFKIDMKRYEGKGYIDIARSKFMLFSYDSVNGNPLGKSCFASIYKPWREKVLIADYQTIGVSKDVGGLPILYAPASVYEAAAKDPNSEEAKYIRNLMDSLSNLHQGDTSYMMLPSDLAEGSSTNKAFEVKLLGVDGAGKQFDTSKLIEERQKAILNAFGAGFSLLGQSGGGSYALADSQQGTHSFFIEKDINYLLEVFNQELIPQMLALNDILLEDEDMPKLIHGVVDEVDPDNFSKAVQRMSATGNLPKHPELVNEYLTKLNLGYRIPEDIVSDEAKWLDYSEKYLGKATTRSGDSLNTPSGGLNGTAEEVAEIDLNTANQES